MTTWVWILKMSITKLIKSLKMCAKIFILTFRRSPSTLSRWKIEMNRVLVYQNKTTKSIFKIKFLKISRSKWKKIRSKVNKTRFSVMFHKFWFKSLRQNWETKRVRFQSWIWKWISFWKPILKELKIWRPQSNLKKILHIKIIK